MNADQLEILCKGLEDAMTGLETMIQFSKTQADRIAKYEQVLQSIANDYHELSDHKIEVQNLNYKKWAREALEK